MTLENTDLFLLQSEKILKEIFAQVSSDLFEKIEIKKIENMISANDLDGSLQASAFFVIVARDQILEDFEKEGKKVFVSEAFTEDNAICFFAIHYNPAKEFLVKRYQTFFDYLKSSVFAFLIEEWKKDNFYFYNSSIAKIIVNRSIEELVTEVSKKCCGYIDISLYENINLSLQNILSALSLQTYEKSLTKGLIYFTDDPENAEYQFKFENPEDFGYFSLDNLKLMRKLLELTDVDKKTGIISDTNRVYGIGKLKGGCLNYSVAFAEDHSFVLCKDNQELISIRENHLQFKRECFVYEDFENYLPQVFDSLNDKDKLKKVSSKLFGVIQSLINQHKGTILVVMKDAEKYINRYRDLAMVVEPVLLDEKNVEKLSSIDGAIFIDEKCMCYGFGVVLDGVDTGDGNRARGSRYNSSERFYNWCRTQDKAELFVFILSDDGNFNFFPEI